MVHQLHNYFLNILVVLVGDSRVEGRGGLLCFAGWAPVLAHPVLCTSCTGISSGVGIHDSIP